MGVIFSRHVLKRVSREIIWNYRGKVLFFLYDDNIVIYDSGLTTFRPNMTPVGGRFRGSVNWMAGPMGRGLHFGMGITLGTILCWFPIFQVSVPGCYCNGSGECPCLWVQEKFAQFWQSSQKAGLYTAKFMRQFFNDRALDLLRNVRDVLLGNSWNGCVVWLAGPSDFLPFPWINC